MLHARQPYLIAARPSGMDRSILTTVKHMPPAITDISLHFGASNTIAITEIAAKLREYGAAGAGAATGIYAKRMQAFAASVRQYQDALLEYRAVVKANPAVRAVAQEKVLSAFQRMQSGFQAELNAITSRIRARRGIPLTNSRRALNIARSSRRIAKLQVADQVEASNLAKIRKIRQVPGKRPCGN
jgi:hypothetical protein